MEGRAVGIGLIASVNLFLFLFNLIPLLPLDGGHVAGALYGELDGESPKLRGLLIQVRWTWPDCCRWPGVAVVLISVSIVAALRGSCEPGQTRVKRQRHDSHLPPWGYWYGRLGSVRRTAAQHVSLRGECDDSRTPVCRPQRSPWPPRRRSRSCARSPPVRSGVGGDAPVSVQSMTTTVTADINATLQQIAELTAAGCQVVRVAVPSQDDAEALPQIAP